jgi:L-lactate dehydrogenase (cytochrome)
MKQAIDTLRSVLRFRRFETDRNTRTLRTVASVEDLRRIARRRLPRGVFNYIDGAAEDEITASENMEAFRRLRFSPDVLNNVTDLDTSTTILGADARLPLILAPTGFTRIADPAGEIAVARAAARAGIPYTLSTLSTRSIEEVATAGGDQWFQVYVWRDRGLVAELLERAHAARFRAIVITVDTAMLGRRERDIRRGFTLPPQIGPETLLDGALHPAWTLAFLRSEPIRFANVTGSAVGDGADPVSLADYINSQFDPSLSWADIEWFRNHWNGPIVVKGIQKVADAKIAADVGIDAIALSNHGGRQLDGAPSPIDLVAPTADAVGGSLEIYCDGGIRRGSDIVKAVSLGANACMAGRAYLYGLAAAGERGVDFVLELLEEDVRRVMTLCGRTTTAELNRDLVASPDRDA